MAVKCASSIPFRLAISYHLCFSFALLRNCAILPALHSTSPKFELHIYHVINILNVPDRSLPRLFPSLLLEWLNIPPYSCYPLLLRFIYILFTINM